MSSCETSKENDSSHYVKRKKKKSQRKALRNIANCLPKRKRNSPANDSEDDLPLSHFSADRVKCRKIKVKNHSAEDISDDDSQDDVPLSRLKETSKEQVSGMVSASSASLTVPENDNEPRSPDKTADKLGLLNTSNSTVKEVSSSLSPKNQFLEKAFVSHNTPAVSGEKDGLISFDKGNEGQSGLSSVISKETSLSVPPRDRTPQLASASTMPLSSLPLPGKEDGKQITGQKSSDAFENTDLSALSEDEEIFLSPSIENLLSQVASSLPTSPASSGEVKEGGSFTMVNGSKQSSSPGASDEERFSPLPSAQVLETVDSDCTSREEMEERSKRVEFSTNKSDEDSFPSLTESPPPEHPSPERTFALLALPATPEAQNLKHSSAQGEHGKPPSSGSSFERETVLSPTHETTPTASSALAIPSCSGLHQKKKNHVVSDQVGSSCSRPRQPARKCRVQLVYPGSPDTDNSDYSDDSNTDDDDPDFILSLDQEERESTPPTLNSHRAAAPVYRSNHDLSSSDDSSDSEVVIAEKVKEKTKKHGISFQWRKGDIAAKIIQNIPQIPPSHLKEPIEYFNYYFNEEILDLIVEQSNLYSTQTDKYCMNITRKELQIFLGILIYMGIASLPSYKDYWSGSTRIPQIADNLTLKRFEKIRSRLHFVDNNFPNADSDRYWKVRPVLNHIRDKCASLEQKETFFSIDESMVPYKGKKAGNRRQYIKSKPHKWGFKFFMLTDSKGLVHDFIPYGGSTTFPPNHFSEEEESLGVGGKVVVHLCRSIQHPRLSVVSFDNFFTSLPLLAYLKKEVGLLGTGTIRSNRTHGCPLESDKELLKRGRGNYDARVSSPDDIIVVKWADNKIVNLASTFSGVHPVSTIERWDKNKNSRVPVKCPNIVKQYNSYMGGVDLFDMMVELMRIPSRSKRWYMPIFTFMIHIALVNAHLLYKRDAAALGLNNNQSSKYFRLQVFSALVASPKKRGRPASEDVPVAKKIIRSPVAPLPVQAVRSDEMGHWPNFSEKKGRCRNCTKGYSFVKCMKCDIILCLFPQRNCFYQFHHR